MFYKNWKPIYEKIAKDFDFQIEGEKKSAELLDKFLEIDSKHLRNRISGYIVNLLKIKNRASSA